jgi:hypothetical protein
MKKTLLAGLAAVLFLLTSTGIAMAGDDAKNKTDSNNSKTTGLYDNVRILQEQIDSLTERLGRIETLLGTWPRFADMSDGTIRDNPSGLIWLKDANCFGHLNWSDAMAAAASLKDGQCGLEDGSAATDWRLPTKDEWAAFFCPLEDPDCYDDPALVNRWGDEQWSEGDAFNRVQWELPDYWSSTDYGSNNAKWVADMGWGYMDFAIKSDTSCYVWPVRNDN